MRFYGWAVIRLYGYSFYIGYSGYHRKTVQYPYNRKYRIT